MSPVQKNKAEIRARLALKRHQLDAVLQKQVSASICRRLQSHPVFQIARTIALYSAFDREPDLFPLISAIPKKWVLPVVVDKTQMDFVVFSKKEELVKGRYGILQPKDTAKKIDVQEIDLILLPMVAFDTLGNRIGRGAGHYDRALAFLSGNHRIKKPHLIGVAYEFQKIENSECDPWDIRLNGVVTEANFYEFF